jgi:hypothetical protein
VAEAAQLYAAFRSVCPVDEEGDLLLPLEQLEDSGRGWFAIANALKTVAAPATDTTEPYEVDLVPIAPRIAPDGIAITESEDERPTKLKIRGFTAADLCVAEYGSDRFTHAVFARAMGIELDTVEWRMDPSDVEGGIALCGDAMGDDASDICRRIYFEGGGTQLIARAPAQAWSEVAEALLFEVDGAVARIHCRTPGVGIMTIGPIRAGHMRLHTGTAAREKSEWKGRLVALAKASDRALGQMLALRPEDAVHAWGAFEALKKKAGQQQNTAIGARLSAMSSAAHTGPKTSTT